MWCRGRLGIYLVERPIPYPALTQQIFGCLSRSYQGGGDICADLKSVYFLRNVPNGRLPTNSKNYSCAVVHSHTKRDHLCARKSTTGKSISILESARRITSRYFPSLSAGDLICIIYWSKSTQLIPPHVKISRSISNA